LRGDYSFEARAAQIVSEVGALSARPRPAQPTTGSSGPAPLRELASALLAQQRGHAGTRDIEMFHVYPTPAGGNYLSAHAGLGYLSGGIGPGPWHVALCEDVAQVLEQRFDCILLEETAALERLGGTERLVFFDALIRRVRTSGTVGVLAGDDKSTWTGLLKSLDLTIVAESSQWVIATRQPGKR
jgi:hypothetical protein